MGRIACIVVLRLTCVLLLRAPWCERCSSARPGSQRASPVARPATTPRAWSRVRVADAKRGRLVGALADQTDEHAGEQREDERLQECDEDLEHADGNAHEQRRGRNEPASEREDQTDEREQYHVAG